MKSILIAAALLFSAQAQALTIFASLDSFEGSDASINGGSPGGGRGTFSIVGGDALPQELAFLQDAPTFEAICLEPQEFVSTGVTYVFNVVDLEAAPTNPGAMGAASATAFLEVMEFAGHTRVEDITGVQQLSMAQIAAWEAAQELGPTFDVAAGTAVVTGAGQGDVLSAQAVFDGSTGLDGWGLLNVGTIGAISTRTLYTAQDFVVFNETVPTPGVLALMGLGLLGLVGVRRKA